jgi:TonB family protein
MSALTTSVLLHAQSSAPQITPDDAGRHRGKVATVCGVVISSGCRANEGTLLNFATKEPRASFSILIPHASRSAFPEHVEGDFLSLSVCATGKIERREGSWHQIKATSPAAIQVAAESGPPLQFAPGAHWGCEPGATLPRRTRDAKPEYPADALSQRVEGAVVLLFVVNVDGAVGDVKVLRSVHPSVDQSAVAALKQWQFEPGTLTGKAVPVYLTATISFTAPR